ncbi:hypothetical protein ACFY8K_35925 [Streptomyces misionensis]|uniref:hypothetical protein n=1 Tax=Streptomyces misionensis TaxID=67331 RepID=UPI00367C54E1
MPPGAPIGVGGVWTRATDEDGRGLHVVNRLARRWGATRLSTGKVTWFEVDRPIGAQ